MTTTYATIASTTAEPQAEDGGALRIIDALSAIVRVILTGFIILIFVALGAKVFGFEANRVLSGSMEPAIMTGDWVLSRAATAGDLAVGTVLNYRLGEGREAISVTHRVIALNADGSAVMKGDNNGVADTSPITEDDVLGVVFHTVEASMIQVGLWIFFGGIALYALLTCIGSLIERTHRATSDGRTPVPDLSR